VFERSHRHVMLTPVGKEIATRAQRLLVDAEELVGWARNAQEAIVRARSVRDNPDSGPYVLPSLLSHLGTALPKLKLYGAEAPTPVLLDKLAGGELDILLVAFLRTWRCRGDENQGRSNRGSDAAQPSSYAITKW